MSKIARKSSKKAGPKAMAALLAERDALPFRKCRTRGVPGSWWNVAPTGDYHKDYATGRSYAVPLLPLMLRNAGPPTLSTILGDMFEAFARRKGKYSRRGKLSGIEIGFMRGLGDLILCGIASTVWVGLHGAGKGTKDFTPKHGEVAVKLIDLLATSSIEHDRQEAAAIRAELEGATRQRRRRSRKEDEGRSSFRKIDDDAGR
jgi:hypothetical protein